MTKTKNQSLADFVWPEFNSDRERIKEYSKRYKNMSIKDAFEHTYGIKINSTKESINDVPKPLAVGDRVNLNVLNINKDKVEFDIGNYKTPITSAVNLNKYKRFKNNIPTEKVLVQVVEAYNDRVVVDPIMPLLDNYLSPILRDKNVQRIIGKPMVTRVKNLQLMKGGFTGQAVIPNVSEFVGEDFTVDVFIPGSQIVLNITDNFEQFVGKDVDAFIINYLTKPNGELSLIASVKELIKFNGECRLIELFNSWCEESKLWKDFETQILEGTVTGVINSSKKCGVFVEIPSLNMTGLVSVEPSELVNYKANSSVQVKLTGFDEERKYNSITKHNDHVEPYIIENGHLVRCNLKPVLEFVQ